MFSFTQASFNATTAFLLLIPQDTAISSICCFNATTAFLLRFQRFGGSSLYMCFNATTAFLLPPPSWRGGSVTSAFQCHHGVPASDQLIALIPKGKIVSMPPRRSCFQVCERLEREARKMFQCHHGVPASSWKGKPARA